MSQTPRRYKRVYTLHNAETDPGLRRITQPIPAYQLPPITPLPWHQRFASYLHQIFTFIVRKIILTINFALALLLLLLFTRFLLTAFSLHDSLFSSWTFQLSDPLLIPFNHLLPMLPYRGLLLDTNLLIAILTYTILTKLFTSFLHGLLGIKKKKSRPIYP